MTTSLAINELSATNIMTEHVDTLSPDDSVKEAVNLMLDSRITTIPIVDARNRCIGILSRSDLNELFLKEDEELSRTFEKGALSLDWLSHSLETCEQHKIKEFMTHDVQAIPVNGCLPEICDKMKQHRIHHLPVIDEQQQLVGIVSAFDVVGAIADFYRE